MLHLFGRSRDEKGQSISVLFAISVVALLAVGGLVVDGGAHATATRKAQQAASSAARAAVDASAPARAAGVPIGLNEVVSAGNHALDVAGVEGTVHRGQGFRRPRSGPHRVAGIVDQSPDRQGHEGVPGHHSGDHPTYPLSDQFG